MTTHYRTLAAIMALALALPCGVLMAESSAKDMLKARHDHYHDLGDAFKTVRDQLREKSPDASALKQAAQHIRDASIDQSKWFPAGTGPEAGKTRALPEIWSKPKEFLAAQKMFSDAAPRLLAAAEANDVERMKAQFGEVGKSCKNCHDAFRAPEEHD